MNERITTCGILVDKEGRVLVARRNQGHGHDFVWELPGGKNRYGETPEATLKREWKEELNLQIEVGPQIAACSFENNDTVYHLKAFIVECGNLKNLVLNEHSEYRFVSRNEQRALDMMNSDRMIFETVWMKINDFA
jgi:ADP-ribose pyrophosphatase